MRFFIVAILLSTVSVMQAQTLNVLWQREGAGDSSLYGSAILALGDQDDDGYNDWAVYAAGLGYAPEGSPEEPKVEFFYGGDPPVSTPYMTRVAHRETEIAIEWAKTVGDLNGDGYIDWAIIITSVDDPEYPTAYKIYFGGPHSLDDPGDNEPDLWLSVPSFSAYYGIGDFNGDGYDDLLLSDGWSGRAEMYFGGNPMNTIPDWSRETYIGVARAGNFNGDDYSDFICYGGFSYFDIYLGSATPDTTPTAPPACHLIGEHDVVASVSDVDHDGYDDMCLELLTGIVIYWGGESLDTPERSNLTFPYDTPDLIISAGDYNGDNYGDVVMLERWCSTSWYGVLTLHLGGAWLNPNPAVVIYGWTAPLNLINIRTAAALGDINGDGVDDLAVGANGGIEYLAQRGKAVILAGDSTMVVGTDDPFTPAPLSFALSVYPNPFNATTTLRLTLEREGVARLTIYDVTGRLVDTPHEGTLPAGTHDIRWDASALASGIYLAHVEVNGLSQTAKLVLLK